MLGGGALGEGAVGEKIWEVICKANQLELELESWRLEGLESWSLRSKNLKILSIQMVRGA